MKIVFIVGSYHPYFSAIGKCVFNLVKELEKEHEIIVISNMDVSKFPSEETYEMHKIIRVRSKSMQKRDKLIYKYVQANSILKKWCQIKLFTLRIIGALKIVFSKYSLQKDLINKYLQALSNIKNIDLIIPTCYPFESIIAAQKFKSLYDKNVQIKPFLFDKFSDSPTLHRSKINKKIKFRNHLNLEEKMIVESQKIHIVDSWIKHVDKYFINYKDKIINVEHPLIIDYYHPRVDKNANDSFINIIYTGVLDKKVRPPQLTLNTLSEVIRAENNIKVHFYILGNCGDIVNKYCSKHPDNITNYGQVESNKAVTTICKSDILLSIGNTDVTLIPSKIFEYMSSGKPVIHFYTSEDDRIIEMLDKYDLALCLKQVAEPNQEYINKIITFIRSMKGAEKSFDDVSKDFFEATPKFIANKIINRTNT